MCSLIDHSQRPMKMHIEVTLLYNDQYLGLVIQSLVDKPFSTNIFVIKTIGGGGGGLMYLGKVVSQSYSIKCGCVKPE